MLCFPKLISSFPAANPPLPEHKIGIFVRFWGLDPQFSGVSSTKSGFLCFFGLRNPCFRAFRAQNRGFCAFLAFETPIFGLFEHKIEVFVLFCPSEPSFSGFSSTKSAFLCSRGGESGMRLRDYVSAIKRKQGELPCYSFVHLSGRRSRYASEFEPGGKAAVLLSTSDR